MVMITVNETSCNVKKKLTIVMYHFVRDLAKSRFPGIKGLSIDKFKGQIQYLRKHYTFISASALIDAVAGASELPKNPVLLTFDDAYIDHYTSVFPTLDEFGLSGLFFPPARAVLENKVLDVNKIHFILASVDDHKKLNDELFNVMSEFRNEFNLPPHSHYQQMVDISGNRWDTPEVAFFKRMLQRELPEAARVRIVDALFSKFVTADETAFARELYLDIDQIRCMQRHGMSFGSHGYNHAWLNHLLPAEQEKEIDLSIRFLKEMDAPTDRWIISYPYGGWNDSLLQIAKRKGCVAGLTTNAKLADLAIDNPLLLPRINTNDLPFNPEDAQNQTRKSGNLKHIPA